MDHLIVSHPIDADANVRTCEGYLKRAKENLRDAKTPADRREAAFWVKNARENLSMWRAIQKRGQP